MTSTMTVTHPRAVQLLTRHRARRVLGAFLTSETTVAAAAKQLDADIRIVHRDVLALMDAGLLQVVREQPRAGRAVKVYRATAPAFFVPFSATSAVDFGDLGGDRAGTFDALFQRAAIRTFEGLHREQGGGREWGTRVYWSEDGRVQVDQSYEGAALVSPARTYQGPTGLVLDVRSALRLTHAEARGAKTELITLLRRLSDLSTGHENAGTGTPVLLRLGLVGVTDGEHQTLT